MLVRFAIVPPRDCPAVARGEENERLFRTAQTAAPQLGWVEVVGGALKNGKPFARVLSPWCSCFLHAGCTISF